MLGQMYSLIPEFLIVNFSQFRKNGSKIQEIK